MNEYINKSYNVSVLLCHFACLSKYRTVVFSANVEQNSKENCIEISKRFGITFIEIGAGLDHLHFFIQSVPNENPTKNVRTVKWFAAKEILKRHPEGEKRLCRGKF